MDNLLIIIAIGYALLTTTLLVLGAVVLTIRYYSNKTRKVGDDIYHTNSKLTLLEKHLGVKYYENNDGFKGYKDT